MSVQSLAQQAGLRIPIKSLFYAQEHEGNVINQEFLAYVRPHRIIARTDLRALCKICRKNGDCLCYLFQIRQEMMDSYWGSMDDYLYLKDWLTLTNPHIRMDGEISM